MLPARLLRGLSGLLVRVERVLVMGLVAGIAGFVLLNVGFRLFRVTLAWADEAAVLCMVLAAFVGASLMLRMRSDPAVRLLHQMVSPAAVRVLRAVVSAVAAGFGGVLGWLCWRWFDPAGLWAAGFDIDAFEMATFNFLYTETTPILRLPFWWFWLVLPWFALTLTVHALTNLAEDTGLIAPAPPEG
ncbi:MAG: TRAP transporter small permease [Alkalilacustris sp.]